MVTELFANLPATTVSSGGTDAPSGGTQETWTVASSSSFPAAVTNSSQFHVSDPAQPSEVVAVTNVSGTTWTVTRGAENTTPVAHSVGFTVKQIVTAGFLGSLSPLSGQYLCPPSQYAPGTQTTFTTTSGILSAMSSANINTGSFTAPPSGNVVANVSMVAGVSNDAFAAVFALAEHGTASPVQGYTAQWKFTNSAFVPVPYSQAFQVTGLAPGTAYNFDLMFAVATGGTLSVFAIGQTGTAPSTASSGLGAPVTMTVQAV